MIFQKILFKIGKDFNKFRFKNKILFVTGDSITEANNLTTKNWHSYIKDWLGFKTVKNDGKSGTGVIVPFGKNVGIYTRMDSWDSSYGNFDIILLMGNMNDGKLGSAAFPLGKFSDAPYPIVQSQYAVLHSIIQKMLVKYPNKPIGWIISTPRRTAYSGLPTLHAWGRDGWFEPYANAILEVCGHYSIPCLDLYHNSGLRPWNDTNNASFFSGADGTHPNLEGHKIMAEKIMEFVKQFV